MFFETKDAISIIGYAGLGATSLGTEPSDWIGDVLKMRNVTFKQSLNILAEALESQFPKHLSIVDKKDAVSHVIVITAFLQNKPVIYTINLEYSSASRRYRTVIRHIAKKRDSKIITDERIWIVGSGASQLMRDQKWERELLDLVKKCDQKKAAPITIAKRLAMLNYTVSLQTKDNTVGPYCIVGWRHKRKGIYGGGGSYAFYRNDERVKSDCIIPAVAGGMDIKAISEAILPLMVEYFDEMREGKTSENIDKKIGQLLKKLPTEPDEQLR